MTRLPPVREPDNRASRVQLMGRLGSSCRLRDFECRRKLCKMLQEDQGNQGNYAPAGGCSIGHFDGDTVLGGGYRDSRQGRLQVSELRT